jgi:type IV secretion system protein TrbB
MNDIQLKRQFEALKRALSPVIEFLDDPRVMEIMLNADGRIWVDEAGSGMRCTDVTMSPDAAERIIRLLASNINVEVNDRNPSLSAKLPIWGVRVQASVRPIVESPTFALRKPTPIVYPISDYVSKEILSAEEADCLITSIKQKKNILVGGGTGSGKTALVNSLLAIISETKDRLYIVEDNPELRCDADNKIQILTNSYYDCRHAVMDALRYRPDRILVGEVRDGTALELVKAWNTGHPGGLATIHANDSRSMLDRLCQLIEEAVPKAPHHLVADAVNICVYITKDSRHPAGRRISEIVKVCGIDEASGAWVLEDVSGKAKF